MLTVHLTAKSKNVKTGPIPVSTTSADTCPDSCPLKAGGCYAKGGPLGMHWAKVTSGERGMRWQEFCDEIEDLPAGQLWRHNQAGDLPGRNGKIYRALLTELVDANKGRRGFTYTHYDMSLARNRLAAAKANLNGFTINLSANNLTHADKLADMGCGPVVTLLPEDAPRKGLTPNKRPWIACPAQENDGLTCADCQLCQRQRKVIVGFRVHGSSKRKAEAIATN